MASTAPDNDVPSASSSPGKTNRRDKRSSTGHRSANAPMSFVMKTQEQMDAHRAAANRPAEESMFGVESLQDTINTADRLDSDASQMESPRHLEPSTAVSSDQPRFSMPTSFNFPTHIDLSALDRTPSLSRAARLHSPALDSGPLSTPKSASIRSFRLSDDELSVDEASSQALASSEEGEGDEHHAAESSHDQAYDDAAPQLVMPSIRMPARRPFTERGKNIGRLKIMVAGRAAVGKTSLIRSIVQTCDDIVHVDPLDSPSVRSSEKQSPTIRSVKDLRRQQVPIMTINASTRPYPSWWADLDDSRVLRRRKSFNETVLERNVSFIDTPGFHDRLSFELYRTSLVDHIQSNLHRNASIASLGEGELLSVLSGTGGFQVDLVLYVCSGIPDSEEAAFMRRLSQLTNMIPILSKSDLLSTEQLNTKSVAIGKRLDEAGVNAFDLRRHSKLEEQADPNVPFSVSGAPSRDDDTMEASLLMSSGYLAPLEPSQLRPLVDALFEPELVSCLRHTASKKYIQWHRSFAVHAPSMSMNTLRPGRLPSRAISSPSPHYYDQTSDTSSASVGPYLGAAPTPTSSDTSSSSSPLFPLLSTNNPYALARITDHTQREERLAQAHLSRWAADLQRALRNERAHFAAMQQAERHAWLSQRLEECISVDACKEGKPAADAIMLRSTDLQRRARADALNPQDPLGLLVWSDNFSRRSLFFAQLVGGAGVVGAVVVWAMNVWGWEFSAGVHGGSASSWRSGFGWRWSGEWSWTI